MNSLSMPRGRLKLTSTDPAALAEQWLAEAYELICDGWCQRMEACDSEGSRCEPSSERAARWSASGALVRVWGQSYVPADVGLVALQRANLALAATVNEVPDVWNDQPERKQHEVAEALLQAVTLVRDPALFGAMEGQREGGGPAA